MSARLRAPGLRPTWRTVLGIPFIAMLYKGFALLRIDPLSQGIALGAIILLAVGFDAWSRFRRRWFAASRFQEFVGLK